MMLTLRVKPRSVLRKILRSVLYNETFVAKMASANGWWHVVQEGKNQHTQTVSLMKKSSADVF